MSNSMRMYGRIAFVAGSAIVCVFGLFVSGASAQVEDGVRARFFRDARVEWEKYKLRAHKLQFEIIYDVEDLTGKNKAENTHVSLLQRNDSLCIKTGSGPTGDEGKLEVFAYNPKYRFQLARKSSKTEWLLIDHEIGWKPTAGKKSPFNSSATLYQPFAIELIAGRTGSVTLIDNSVSIDSISAITWKEKLMAKINFRYTPPLDLKGAFDFGGHVILDPAHHWVFQELDVMIDNNRLQVRNEYQYDFLQDGFPVLNRVVTERKVVKSNIHNRTIAVFKVRETQVSEEPFYLNGYGIKDLVDQTPSLRSYAYLWLTFVAFGILGVFVFIRRRRLARGS